MASFTALPLPAQAAIYGFASASSMLLGALLGMVTQPAERFVALLMAFGAGCLIYAISVELFGAQGELLRDSPDETWLHFRFNNSVIAFVMSTVGAVIYLALNDMLVSLQQSGEDGVYDGSESAETSATWAAVEMPRMPAPLVPQPQAIAHRATYGAGAEESPAHSGPTGTKSSLGTKSAGGGSIHALRSGLAARSSHLLHPMRFSERSVQPADDPTVSGPVSMINVPTIKGESPEEKARHAQQVAFSMWLGLLLDGIPESLLIGFMTNSDNITIIFVIAIFIANFPEAYSASAILTAQGLPGYRVFGMWLIVFLMTGTLASFGSFIMPEDVHGDTAAERLEERGGAILEGITGGSMMAMIATAMLPEAFHMAGALSGLTFVGGFVFSDLLSGFGDYVAWAGPPCNVTLLPQVLVHTTMLV